MRGLISDDGSEIKRPQHPRKNANIFGIFTYSWLISLFSLGRNRDLNENDLYTTLEDFSSSLLGNKLEKIWKSEMTYAFSVNRDPSLLRAMIRMFGVKYMIYGLCFCINETTFKIIQPVLIGQLLLYIDPIYSNETNSGYAYICASGLLLSMFISIIIQFSACSEIIHTGMKMRIACNSIIFRKVLCLSHKSLDKTTIGQMINLISTDTNKFDTLIAVTHYVWIGPLQVILVTYLLWHEIGIFSLLGVVTFSIFISIQVFLGKNVSIQSLKSVKKTDERIRLMNEIISGIQLIKMYTWEKSFAKLICYARKKEIQQIKKLSYVKLIMMIFKQIQIKFQVFIIIITYVLLGNNISARKVYVIISFYNLLSISMSSWFVHGLRAIAELQVTIKRIQTFLLLEEKDCMRSILLKSDKEETTSVIELNNYKNSTKTIFLKKNNTEHLNLNDISIGIIDATAKWTDAQTNIALGNINLTVKSGELVTIIGPVGAGKSSLIQLILRELTLLEGKVSVDGVISYASQEPWLFAGSIQQNILFGSQMNVERYKQVIEVCALKSDLEKFPFGDKTIVGERGVTLSGGQKARINLARAIYKQADIYLLDDPLSAVDTHVGKYVFEKCIKDYLKEKTCLLVTHQLHYLTNVNQIVLLENAKITAIGTYQELQDSKFDFAKLLVSSEEISNECDDRDIINNDLSSHTRSPLGSHQSILSNVESKENGVKIVPIEKKKKDSSVYVTKSAYVSYFHASGNICRIILFFCMFVFSQTMVTGGDYWLSFWVNQEEYYFQYMNNESFQNGTLTVRGSTDFLTQQTNVRHTCVIVYSILIIMMIVSTFTRTAISVSVCMRASTNLHNTVFNSIIRGTLRFFDLSSSGKIFNCFSNDIGDIDNNLPLIMCDSAQEFLKIFGIIFVVNLVNIYLIIPTIIIGSFCCLLKAFILPAFRSFIRLESITRSPLFAHINESLHGLKTIRAFQVEQILSNEFDKHQDLYSSASYLLFSSNHAFSLWLDIICIIYLGIVTFSFLVIDNNFYRGLVGLALTESMRLVHIVRWAIKQLVILENKIHSVERILEFIDISQEANFESSPVNKPPKEWPQSGDIIFQNLSLRYSPDLPCTLKNLSFRIHSMEKVGIVGRTGAGKSSVLSALFRLAINEGNIIIDGIEIHNLGLHDLRSKLSVIPQEPVLFSGTIRTNLDPFDEYPDHILWNALDEVKLKSVIENSLGGLNSKMSEGGSNFSVGQKQLFCLARSIVRNNKILVLDEATANVDPQTDALIQTTIRNKFEKCTVLTIAHRLNTIMDSDKVLVIDAGSVVEFDHPYDLLQNKNGYFYKMVEKTGQVSADLLKKVASESFMTMKMRRKLPIKMIDANEDIS